MTRIASADTTLISPTSVCNRDGADGSEAAREKVRRAQNSENPAYDLVVSLYGHQSSLFEPWRGANLHPLFNVT